MKRISILLLICILMELLPLPMAFAQASYEGLHISEVFSGGNGEEELSDLIAADWIEIANDGASPVELDGLVLHLAEKPNKMYIFPSMQLSPGEYLLVFCKGKAASGEFVAPFKLPASGSQVVLTSADLCQIDAVDVPRLQADQSYALIDDDWTVTTEVTPGDVNTMYEHLDDLIQVTKGDVILTEVMTANNLWFPDEAGEYCDYIEVMNISGHDVDLEGYALSDNEARLSKWRFPSVILKSGECLAVHCSSEDKKDDPGHLHASFRLSRQGDVVYLSNKGGTLIDMVDVPALEKSTAYSYVDDRWTDKYPPTPNLPNTMAGAAQADQQLRARHSSTVIISEVMASPENEPYDWVELYNASDSAVDLSGCYLTNSAAKPRRWQLPQGTAIQPRSFLGIYFTGSADITVNNVVYCPLSLSKDGGYTVCLSAPSGQVADAVFVGQQYKGISYGRGSTSGIGWFESPTPLASNGDGLSMGLAEQPVYSVEGGLYTTGQSFQVTLSAPSDARIYYTLDCSDPTESSSLYTGTPISVSGTTILRTRVYRNGYMPSVMDTQSYLYDVHNADDVAYVVSLVSDPVGLYSDETGIMVMGPNATSKFPYGDYGKGANFWMDWEREAHVELFTQEGTAISQECGIKLHGRNTRAYELKCFKVKARSKYGDSMFRYPLFSRRPYDEYEAFLLRYAGQDYKTTFMRDPMLTRLARNTDVLYQESELCIVYLNGEYYSAMYVRENVSAFSICRYNGWEGQEDDIDLVKEGTNVMQGSNENYAALKEWIKVNDCSTTEAYQRIAADVDIDNFLEHCALIAYIGTPDTVNVKRYRNTNADGKWKWVLYDVDRGLREDIDGFALLAQGVNGILFQGCMDNPVIRERYFAILNEALATYCNTENVLSAVEAQRALLEPVLPDYLANLDVSMSKYNDRYNGLVSVIKKRPKQVLQYAKSYFKLSDDDMYRYFGDAIAALGA